MAWSARKAKRKYKGVKWIDTPFAKPYKMRRAVNRMQMAMAVASGIARLSVLRAHPDPSPLKMVNMAQTTIQTVQSVVELQKQFDQRETVYNVKPRTNSKRNREVQERAQRIAGEDGQDSQSEEKHQ